MASNAQGNFPVVDLTFKNYGGSDIAAGLAVLADTSHPPSGDVPGGVVLPTASGGVAGTIGITVEIIKAGGTGRVRVLGGYPCTANGTITYGDIVQASDTSAKLGWAKTCGAATRQLGIAMCGASNGEVVQVFVFPAANA